MLKKPQRVGIRQFVQRVEQLNAYVGQLPCWYYSLSYNASIMPANVLSSEADLASHVLCQARSVRPLACEGYCG
jgi:hypothetical protein